MTLLKFPERLEGCEQNHKTFVRYGRLSTEGEGVDIFFNKRLYMWFFFTGTVQAKFPSFFKF